MIKKSKNYEKIGKPGDHQEFNHLKRLIFEGRLGPMAPARP
jgi:hypothetical protein